MGFDILQIIGTRPQYEKLIRFDNDYVIDTGQHYSKELIQDSIGVDFTFAWHSLRSAMQALTYHISLQKPKLVVIYGDTFSTFAGAIAAKRCGIPLVHIEAGVRTGTNSIEERIRRRVDQMSTYCFCTTQSGVDNLIKPTEYMTAKYNLESVFLVGDLMYDKFLKDRDSIQCKWDISLMTIHRRENLEDLQLILNEASEGTEGVIWFYMHPHTAKYTKENDIVVPKNILVREPVDHKDLLTHLFQSKKVITDSGGLVREAYWAGVPCEYIGKNPWPETRAFGSGDTEEKIKEIIDDLLKKL